MQASVLSERRGDQPKQHNKQGEESRDADDPEPDQHTTADKDEARREGDEAERGKGSEGQERGAKGAEKGEGRERKAGRDAGRQRPRGRRTTRTSPRTRGDPRPDPKPPGRHKGQQAKAGAEGEEKKRTRQVPTTTRHRRGFWCEPSRDTPSAGQYQSGGHSEQVRGAGQAKIGGPKATEGRSTAPTDRSSRGQGREDQKTPRPSALDSAAICT